MNSAVYPKLMVLCDKDGLDMPAQVLWQQGKVVFQNRMELMLMMLM
jgi:hypothetical protein